MRTYKDKEELKAEISKGFEKYIAEVPFQDKCCQPNHRIKHKCCE